MLVAAENAEEATAIIKNFQKSDSNKKEKNIYTYTFLKFKFLKKIFGGI